MTRPKVLGLHPTRADKSVFGILRSARIALIGWGAGRAAAIDLTSDRIPAGGPVLGERWQALVLSMGWILRSERTDNYMYVIIGVWVQPVKDH